MNSSLSTSRQQQIGGCNRYTPKKEHQKTAGIIFLLCIVFFIFFYWLIPYCISVDTEQYRYFYDAIGYEDSWSGRFSLLQNSLGSSEPGYLVLVYLFSPLMSYDLFITIGNTILVLTTSLFFFKHLKLNALNISFLLCFLLSYYFIVLCTSADRLKIAMIFLLISYITEKGQLKLLFGMLACLSHVQLFFLLLPVIVNTLASKTYSRQKRLYFLLVALVVGFFFWNSFSEYVIGKIVAYQSSELNIDSFIKTLALLVLTFVFVRTDRKNIAIVSIPLLISALFLGGSRITIMAYFLFLGYHIIRLEKVNTICWVVTLYFLIQTPVFVGRILKYGSGYALSL